MDTIHSEEGHPLNLRKTYLAVIENSVGSNLFRELYVTMPDGSSVDVIDDGDLACAFFASSITTLFRLTKCVHTTVDGMIEDLIQSGWVETDKLAVGAVIIWGEKLGTDGAHHKHVGFYIGDYHTVSNVSAKRCPDFHHVTYGLMGDGVTPVRTVARVFVHPKLA